MKFKPGDRVINHSVKSSTIATIIKHNTRFYADTVYLVEHEGNIMSWNTAWMDLIIEANDILKGML